MRKLCLFFLLFTSIISFSQDDTQNQKNIQKQNELKINGLYVVLGAFEVTYERLLNDESGLGVSVFIPYDNDEIDEDINYYVSPYYRFYFGKKYAAGFFVEGFGMLNSYDDIEYFGNDQFDVVNFDRKTKVDFALGIGVGGKWVTNRGMFAELNFGVGRNLFTSDGDGINDVVGKAAITIGFRF